MGYINPGQLVLYVYGITEICFFFFLIVLGKREMNGVNESADWNLFQSELSFTPFIAAGSSESRKCCEKRETQGLVLLLAK